MSILHRLLGIYVVGVAAVVAVSLLATLIWSNGAGSPIWPTVNWLQAIAIIVVLVVNVPPQARARRERVRRLRSPVTTWKSTCSSTSLSS